MLNRCTATLRCCQNCRPACDEEFKQVVNLKKSGLSIYVHNNDLMQKKSFVQRRESVILRNSSDKDLKRFDYVGELCQYKTKCFKCRGLIERIRNLIDNITVISKNEMLGVCDHCKRSTTKNKCQRCEYYLHKFINNETQKYLHDEKKLNEWLRKVQQVLLSVMQGQILCKHNIYLDTESKIHLNNLLKQIDLSKKQRHLSSDFLCDFQHQLKLSSIVSPDIIGEADNEYLKKKERELFDDISSASSSTCICKYLLERNKNSASSTLPEIKSVEDVKLDKPLKKTSFPLLPTPITTNKLTNLKQNVHTKPLKKKSDGSKNKIENLKTQNENNQHQQKKLPESDTELILKMIKNRNITRNEIRNITEHENVAESPVIELPVIDVLIENDRTPSITISKSQSFVECDDKSVDVTEMIKGTQVVPSNRHQTDDLVKKHKPMLFTIEHDFNASVVHEDSSICTLEDSKIFIDNKINGKMSAKDHSGIIKYQLSNKEFIHKGWTKLPTINVVRRMDIYNMVPSYSKFDWFKNHMKEKKIFYDSSEKLAEIYENGCGKWFYKNGKTALDYYSAADINSSIRCILYSSGDEIGLHKKKCVNVMATFDYLGNGVVYDNKGNIRLKYNQSEGFLIDRKIAPAGHWIWHTLNEPPILISNFCDTFVNNNALDETDRHGDPEVIEIELENFRKQKAAKREQVYEPIQIRIKVVKINDYFSLRILNQTKIYIQYRCDRICFKLNVGMVLQCNNIVDTKFVNISETTTFI